MTTTASIRDLTRNSSLLSQYDYVEIEDKKSHELKGLFISPKFAKEFKEYLDNKLNKEREDKLKKIKKFAGKNTIEPRFNELSSKDLKKEVSQEKLKDE
ncbi:MAG: hypothetical protein OIF32_08725 [Campylobacterales bacterium]|nr:hypothetical protein [Campylobacterales bacterium]